MKTFRLTGIASALLSMMASANALADDPDLRFYVSPMGSLVTPDSDRGAKYGYGATITVGKRVTPGLELELLSTYTDYKTKAGDFATPQPPGSALYGAGAGANIFFAPTSDGFMKGLFLHIDVQREQAHHTPGVNRAYVGTLFQPGLGYDLILNKQPFGPFPQGVAIRTEVLYRLDSHEEGDVGNVSDHEHKYFQEGVLNIGFRIPLGGRPVAAVQATEAPAEVVPAVETPPPEAPPSPPPPPPPPPCEPPTAGQPISLEGCKTGDTIVLRGVNFDFNKATLTVNARSLLDQVADALLARMDIKVEIDGHTDGKGSVPYNQKLSDHRAASVKKYLVGRGIASDRMTTKGFGKSMPIADNKTDAGRELNRRVELKVTDSLSGGAPVTVTQPGEASTTTGGSGDAAAAAPAADSSAPPADSSATPPADSSATPPADSSSTPPADSSSTPPADSPATPPADSSTPPADSSATPPADSSSATPPAQ